MTIETKYNIGDEVWTYGDNNKGEINGQIQDMKIVAVFLGPTPIIEYTIRRIVNGKLKLHYRLGKDLFTTKEELLKTYRYERPNYKQRTTRHLEAIPR